MNPKQAKRPFRMPSPRSIGERRRVSVWERRVVGEGDVVRGPGQLSTMNRLRFLTLSLLIGIACCGVDPGLARAQTANYSTSGQPEDDGLMLLQIEPYDLIFFTPDSGGGWVKTLPLSLPNRKVPTSPSGTLSFSVVGLEAQRFAAKWTDIAKVDLWEDRLQREARTRIDEGDFVGAYPFLAVLLRDYPTIPGLRALRSDFLIKDAARRFRAGELEPTLAMLEELRRFEPTFKPELVFNVISQVTDSLMQRMVERKELEQAQQLLARMKKNYPGDQVTSIAKWDNTFLEMAQQRREAAMTAFDAEDWRTARQAALDSLFLYPAIEGGKELMQKISKQYPLVRVGVMQEASELDPTRIENWPARRAGRLVYRTLFEMRGTGAEGGEYDFILGDSEQSPDRLQFDLALLPQKARPPMDKFTSQILADLLADRARPGTPGFSPPWAATLSQLSLRGPQQLTCVMRQPHVLPASLLQIRIDGEMLGLQRGDPTGVYNRIMNEQGETRFKLIGDPTVETQPREIVELKMETAGVAVSSLLKGDIDVIDHLYPGDANRLRRSNQVVVENYPLPTVHMLVPCSDHAYLADRNFRRALIYGIDRQDILRGELLENQETPGSRVISGPFPAGIQPNDPLAYAYNEQVIPRTYQPQLAKLLVILATKQMESAAERKKEQPPKLEPLRLAVPNDDLSRVACEAIKTQWEAMGLKVEMVDLPPGQAMPDAGTADIVYVVAAVWEPTIDARRILGQDGLASSNDQFVGLGVRQVEAANTWRDVRDRLQELHATVNHELPIIPLWQVVDAFAYRRDVVGVGREIVSLYQNVERWRLNF